MTKTTDPLEKQVCAIVNELGAKLSALKIPFVCIVGIPTSGNTVRSSNGLEVPEVNLKMRLEVQRYAEFMANDEARN